MKKVLMIISFIPLLFSSMGNINAQSQENHQDSLNLFFKKIDLKSEGKYKDILVRFKHKPNRVAPDFFRTFVETYSTYRMSLNTSVEYKNNKIVLSWFCHDLPFEGNVKEGIIRINQFLVDCKFIINDTATDAYNKIEYHYYKKSNNFTEHFLVKNPTDYLGGSKSYYGCTIDYEITYEKELEHLKVGDVLKVYKEIVCPELPIKVYNYFKDRNFTYIGYGGTWTQYYDWSLSIPDQNLDAAEQDLINVSNIISELGFVFLEEDRSIKTYKKNSSYIYLSIRDGNILDFRIQPYS